MNVKLYFAYGSNMNSVQMRGRCHDSKVIGVGILRGYKLVERLYADIDEDAGSCVYGVLYSISDSDEKTLDDKEGVGTNAYRKIFREIECCGSCYSDVLVYEMTPETKQSREGQPYRNDSEKDYRKICSDGADEHGVPNMFKKG